MSSRGLSATASGTTNRPRDPDIDTRIYNVHDSSNLSPSHSPLKQLHHCGKACLLYAILSASRALLFAFGVPALFLRLKSFLLFHSV